MQIAYFVSESVRPNCPDDSVLNLWRLMSHAYLVVWPDATWFTRVGPIKGRVTLVSSACHSLLVEPIMKRSICALTTSLDLSPATPLPKRSRSMPAPRREWGHELGDGVGGHSIERHTHNRRLIYGGNNDENVETPPPVLKPPRLLLSRHTLDDPTFASAGVELMQCELCRYVIVMDANPRVQYHRQVCISCDAVSAFVKMSF